MSNKEFKVENWGATWRFFWRFARPVYRKIWWCFLLIPMIVAATLVEPSVYRLIIDELTKSFQTGGKVVEMSKLFNLLFFWVGVSLFNLAIYSLYRLVFSYYVPDVEKNYIHTMFHVLLQKDLKKHLEKKSGEMMKEVDRAADYIWQMCVWLYIDLLIPWTLLIAVLIYAVSVSWQMTLVMLITLPLYLFNIFFISKRTTGKQQEVFKKFDEAYGYAYDAIANIMTVKSFGKEEFEHERFKNLLAVANDIQRKISMWWGTLGVSSSFASILTRMMIFSGGVLLVSQGLISVGTIIMFMTFANSFYNPIQQFGDLMRNFQRAMLSMEKARKILEAPNDIVDGLNAEILKVKRGLIEYEEVDFTYNEKKVLKNVSLTIKPGTTMALVGHSGAGKTTMVSLLNRFYDVQSGRILIDGHDITKVTQKSLRKALGFVMQENSLFNATILDNIRYSKPKATMDEVIKAAKQANVHEFIEALPDGYNTKVGERGLKLSGGEKQRVAIARMILKNPPIVILDEATSALDSVNEKIIQAALERLMKGRTSIIIAHRLSTVRKADQIAVMDKGKIVQQGNHEQLMKEHGIYKELVDLQVNGMLAE